MSATKTAQALPDHIYMKGNKLFNGDTHERDINGLKEYAEQEGFDLAGQCQIVFDIPVDWVTRPQHSALLLQVVSFRRTRLEQSGFHHHRCFDCREAFGCSDKDCTKGEEIECRLCHEGEPPATTRWLHNKQVIMI
jgi:hypothetical protein